MQRDTGALAWQATTSRGVAGARIKPMRGAMLWFNPATQHGFVRTEDGERLRVEVGGFAPGHELGDRCAGTVVEFERQAAEVEGGFVAVAVKVVDDTSGLRARSHRPLRGLSRH
jgi:cold shock CspA family protein